MNFPILVSVSCWVVCEVEISVFSLSVQGKVYFQLIQQCLLWGGSVPSQGVFTASGDLILSCTLMDYTALSMHGGTDRVLRLKVVQQTSGSAATGFALVLTAEQSYGLPS